MIIKMNLGMNSYDIVVERGILEKAGQLLNLNRKVLIVTDDGVPTEYSRCVAAQCKDAYIQCVCQGEQSKGFETYQKLLSFLLKSGFSRGDCVVAVGGGVVGDLSGFVAATFMRGIDFYNIPTTLLSQIDSSIGGKTGINYQGIKNVIGTFYQPSLVLVDFDLLNSLDQRHFNNGLVEALKMGYIYDSTILDLFEGDIDSNLEDIINKSIIGKKYYVEQDEKEENIRKILNYGHTFGHGFESLGGFSDKLYHGEAVALGMLVVNEDKDNLSKYLEKLNIKYDFDFDKEKLMESVLQDKKIDGDYIDLIKVDQISEGYISKTSLNKLNEILEGGIDYVRRFRK